MNAKTLGTRLAAPGWRSLLARALVLAGGWWVISEGDRAALLFGLPVVLLALGASLALPSPPGPRWSPTGLTRYAWAFLVGSLRGGVDVARRALAPRLPLAPTLLRFPLRLRTRPARYLFLGTLSMMPGTLSVSLEGDDLAVHVLFDQGEALLFRLRILEAQAARATGERLEGPDA